ncbi:MAG: hypothetical protein LBM01_04000 [Christensenellaceae bacterium]|jgi:hypothetical protein|nr:hypothetical protein [Christensenellaceae bacterium]
MDIFKNNGDGFSFDEEFAESVRGMNYGAMREAAEQDEDYKHETLYTADMLLRKSILKDTKWDLRIKQLALLPGVGGVVAAVAGYPAEGIGLSAASLGVAFVVPPVVQAIRHPEIMKEKLRHIANHTVIMAKSLRTPHEPEYDEIKDRYVPR